LNKNKEKIAFSMKDYFKIINGNIHAWQHECFRNNNNQKFKVPRFLRPMSEWLNLLTQTGFLLDKVEEPFATDESIARYPQLLSTRIVAHSMIIRGKNDEK
jgi:hypothetical protein